MGTRYNENLAGMDMGFDLSLPAKDKAWLEVQKRELISNAWALKKESVRDATALRDGAVRTALGLTLLGGLLAFGGAYAAQRLGRR